MKETLIMFINKEAYQLEKDRKGYTWVKQDINLKNPRTLHTAVTVPETFLCDFKCRHRTQKCEKFDSRGIFWEAQLGQVARQACPDLLPGYARYDLSFEAFAKPLTLGGNVVWMDSLLQRSQTGETA